MLAYLFQQQLITCQQFAFLSKCSTCNQLFDYINDWTLSVRNRHSVDVIYFDFPEAFYSVSHPKLVHKIHAYGFSGCIPNILKDFLSARTQRVFFLPTVLLHTALLLPVLCLCHRISFLSCVYQWHCYAPPLIGGGIKRWCCLTSVCLSPRVHLT